ncbi:MAG: fatty acid hydroxylase [Myxococcales bacterium]|nr:fatty acid hydroxylase [Myxococcales bacterium]
MATLAAFWILVLAGAVRVERRRAYLVKSRAAWTLDAVGLAIQGGLVPLVQLTVVVSALTLVVPSLRGSLRLPGHAVAAGFVVNVVVVDYLYYWNHRLLHTARLWPIHLVHHTVDEMDVMGTSRNTAWTSFFILYVWVNGVMLYLLAEPAGFAAGAALTASLDLWRHSELSPPRGSLADRALGSVLILPRHHAWHHAGDAAPGNFGANFSLWDRLHGTFIARDDAPARLGVTTTLPLWRQLWWPFA